VKKEIVVLSVCTFNIDYSQSMPIEVRLAANFNPLKKLINPGCLAEEAGRWEILNIVFHDISYFMGAFQGMLFGIYPIAANVLYWAF